MKRYEKDTIDDLSDIFASWMGGRPENDAEIKDFLQTSKLKDLITVVDLDLILNYNGYFSEETFLAAYSLVPVKLKTKTKELAILPEMFNRLNIKTAKQAHASLINISFAKAYAIFEAYYPEKHKIIAKEKANLRNHNYRQKNPEAAKKAYRRRMANMTEEQKAELREKSRLRMRRMRSENPEPSRAAAREYWRRLSPEQKALIRIESRERNCKYREENREAIRQRAQERRQRLKEVNPELLRELDRRHNQNADRAESCRKYYQKNKEIIAQKARENPKVKEYKRKYKLKKRFQNLTGKTILGLLQGIADSKSL